MRDNADDDDLVKVLIGNKCDIASDTDIQKQAKAFAATNSMEYIETSALTGTAVSTAFETLLNSVHLKAISDQRSGVKRGHPGGEGGGGEGVLLGELWHSGVQC